MGDKTLTYEILKANFTYHENGYLIRNDTGKRAGSNSIGSHGYFSFSWRDRMYLLHRMIFLYHYGYLPHKVDHRDRDKSNNRIENLREASDLMNTNNVGLSKNNTSGYKGVSRYKDQWRARLGYDLIGVYDSPEEAAMMYNKAFIKKFGNDMFINEIKGELI
ncbi:HNH endonuclease protein [Rhizobium phage RHph_N3_19]|nr:HNH endonuclease protein [Rhizobium phage RHph_N3_19]